MIFIFSHRVDQIRFFYFSLHFMEVCGEFQLIVKLFQLRLAALIVLF